MKCLKILLSFREIWEVLLWNAPNCFMMHLEMHSERVTVTRNGESHFRPVLFPFFVSSTPLSRLQTGISSSSWCRWWKGWSDWRTPCLPDCFTPPLLSRSARVAATMLMFQLLFNADRVSQTLVKWSNQEFLLQINNFYSSNAISWFRVSQGEWLEVNPVITKRFIHFRWTRWGWS